MKVKASKGSEGQLQVHKERQAGCSTQTRLDHGGSDDLSSKVRIALCRLKVIGLVLYKLQQVPAEQMPGPLQQLRQELPEPCMPDCMVASSTTQEAILRMPAGFARASLAAQHKPGRRSMRL